MNLGPFGLKLLNGFWTKVNFDFQKIQGVKNILNILRSVPFAVEVVDAKEDFAPLFSARALVIKKEKALPKCKNPLGVGAIRVKLNFIRPN